MGLLNRVPAPVRRTLWIAAFGALAARAFKGLTSLDELPPEPQPAEWPTLDFDAAPPG